MYNLEQKSTAHKAVSAIITGDIINSSKSGDPAVWREPLTKLLNQFGQSPEIWQLYRGDSFQLQIKEAESVIFSAIQIKALIRALNKNGFKGLDVRMAIGIGTIEYPSPRVSESSGQALLYSGRKFEQLKKQTLAIKTPWQELDQQLNLYLKLALLTMDRWSASSAELVQAALKMPNAKQKAIAESLKIPQSRVSERLERAGYEVIMQMESYCRDLLRHGLIIKKRASAR